jgi:hypothetical protein
MSPIPTDTTSVNAFPVAPTCSPAVLEVNLEVSEKCLEIHEALACSLTKPVTNLLGNLTG